MTAVQDVHAIEEVLAVEAIARTIAGIPRIGEALRALEEMGMAAKICGSRITVDGVIEAQLMSRRGVGWWSVYAVDGSSPIWNVGTHCGDNAAQWNGCLE
jgi:hypothetical protein